MTKDQIINAIEALDRSDAHDVAWKAMDRAGIGVFVGISLDDVRERIEDTDLEDATDEQILEAIQAASEADYSNEVAAAGDAVEEQLSLILHEAKAA